MKKILETILKKIKKSKYLYTKKYLNNSYLAANLALKWYKNLGLKIEKQMMIWMTGINNL